MPDNVTAIWSDAFKECSSVKRIVVPKILQDSQYRTFLDCENLVELYLSNGSCRISDIYGSMQLEDKAPCWIIICPDDSFTRDYVKNNNMIWMQPFQRDSISPNSVANNSN